MKKLVIILLCISALAAFKSEKETKSLKNTFAPYFHIGVAVNRSQISGGDYDGSLMIAKHFNSITPENVMKWEKIHPGQNNYTFDLADKFVEMGEKDSMFIVGHTLVWHSQLAEWVKSISDPAQLDNVMKEHINSVMGRYKGRIQAWDVVNEVLNEDGTLRESIWQKVLGDDYVINAFKYAQEVDPNCDLYLNDYNLVVKSKREGAMKLVRKIQDAGVKIDGVGLQGHWGLEWPSLEDIEQSIIDYSSLGVKVMVTELDITVLPNPWNLTGADVNQNYEGSPFMNPYPTYLPDSVDILLAKRYEDIFKIFLKHQDKISRITFWGVQDGDSWLNNWPIKNRTNYPLLFNRNYHPKRAYKFITKLAEDND